VLFFALFMDGFVMIIPSTLCLIVSVTISPERWILFGGLFATASALNNTVTYYIGRFFPQNTILEVIDFFNMQHFWEIATEALQKYGSFAGFWGAIIGLPTQMMTALIGLADAKKLAEDPSMSSHVIQAIIFVFLGHGLKSLVVAGLARFGWIKLEKKFGKEADRTA
jgi:membrane protein YqaA with SNARE-associated domain